MSLFSDATAGDRPQRDIQAERRRSQQARTARTAQATSIGEGVFRVHSGASIRVEDGGDIEITDGGGIRLPDGGTLTIAGGAIRMTSDDGTTGLLYFGPSTSGDPVWLFSFDDGEIAGGLAGTPGQTYWRWQDRQGHDLVSSDGQTGIGLSRPYLNYHLVPTLSAQSVGEGTASMWPSFDWSSYTALWEGVNSMWHPRAAYRVATTTTGGGDVQWRILYDGVQAATGTGSTTGVFDVPGWGGDISPDDEANVTIETRLTGGATRGWLQVTKLYARQS